MGLLFQPTNLDPSIIREYLMAPSPSIVWFRTDLRLHDHAALHAACQSSGSVIPLFIHDATIGRPLGANSKWWLAKSLSALNTDLSERGSRLVYAEGETGEVLDQVIALSGAQSVHWMRSYDPLTRERDTDLKKRLSQSGITAQSHAGNLLFEPWAIESKSGGPFKVFTPFWRSCLAQLPNQHPLPAPDQLNPHDVFLSELPDLPSSALSDYWRPGETGALERLSEFLSNQIDGYAKLRDFPSEDKTSRLSAHLRWGEISPLTILRSTLLGREAGNIPTRDADKFISELGWREFSAQLLFHNPDLPHKSLQQKFELFPWQNCPKLLAAWQAGATGYPIVDAGLRELAETGFMHNRVRMIVASFLIKHLLVDWRMGENFFWEGLVDADPANNTASWQWVAGSGADAAPYFRIFNPITQGEKFDPDGTYTRTYLPELARLPAKYLFSPWTAPQDVLDESGVVLGESYPFPIVDHKTAREKALEAFGSLPRTGEA